MARKVGSLLMGWFAANATRSRQMVLSCSFFLPPPWRQSKHELAGTAVRPKTAEATCGRSSPLGVGDNKALRWQSS
jgi:hypothetical protein